MQLCFRGSAPAPVSGDITEFYKLQPQFAGTVKAALAGDAEAAEHLGSPYHALQVSDPALAAQLPNPEDFPAAVREVVELIRKSKGIWEAMIDKARA